MFHHVTVKTPLKNCHILVKNKHIPMKVKLCRGLRLKPHGHTGNDDAGGFPLTVKCFVPPPTSTGLVNQPKGLVILPLPVLE